ncbi:MAG: (2Fe-2S)-binding protein [Deltaproteobacteria bacterium]|jgi:aerobic carbon-monoxide dehydrogenase small subunit|nr:(2Fe-2S)-binding protein [Deltaproteobacteria bacterium]
MEINIILNGVQKAVEIEERWSLLRVLRDQLGLFGAKGGCKTGDCGTCTVLIDGEPKMSCVILAKNVDSKTITTIEGLSQKNNLHPIQRAFIDAGAVQCGYCTPGMILRAKALLDNDIDPSRQQIREAINPSLCRCTGYQKIIDGITLSSQYIREEVRT